MKSWSTCLGLGVVVMVAGLCSCSMPTGTGNGGFRKYAGTAARSDGGQPYFTGKINLDPDSLDLLRRELKGALRPLGEHLELMLRALLHHREHTLDVPQRHSLVE